MTFLAALLLAVQSVVGHSADGQPATVVRWVDGDTVSVASASGPEMVRLLGIDTPEYRHSSARISKECVGRAGAKAATDRARQLAPVGVVVRLQGDDLDRYHRRLAVVTTTGRVNLGQQLLTEGLARSWPDGPCPITRG